jgi:DNA (cytosine-5)-methyltransferase 1
MTGTKRKRQKPAIISLFSGALGLDLGLEQAGFRIAVAVESNPYAVATIRKNRPGLPIIDRPIEEVDTAEILRAAGLSPGEPLLVSGGPSCQVFSTAGQRRSLEDPRGNLFEHFVRVVRESRPRFFVMENVRGLLSAAVSHRPLNQRGPKNPPLTRDEELGSAFAVVTRRLKRLGYYVVFDELNAADFGVPQIRHRLVFLGSRDGEAIALPIPTHSAKPNDHLKPWVTLSEAIKNLHELKPEYYRFAPARERFLKKIPPGGNWRDLSPDSGKEALGRAFDSWGGRSGFFRRLAWDEPSPALTTRPDSKATSLCHPSELRPLSVGEYARIQQFPPTWMVEGTVRIKYTQVGNAVPVGLGHAIGISIKNAVKSRRRDPSLLKQVLCWNLQLLARACRRPRTIVNPPRMRKDTKNDTLVKWLKKGNRKRRDFSRYAPKELRLELKKLVSALGRRRRLETTTSESEAVRWPEGKPRSNPEKRQGVSGPERRASPAA